MLASRYSWNVSTFQVSALFFKASPLFFVLVPIVSNMRSSYQPVVLTAGNQKRFNLALDSSCAGEWASQLALPAPCTACCLGPVRCAHSCLIEHRHLVSRARAACSSCANGKSCTLCMFPMCVTNVNVVWCARTCYQVPVIFQHALRTTRMKSRANVLVDWCAAALTTHVSIHRCKRELETLEKHFGLDGYLPKY